jgi:autotransporter-associated beta strand protein
MKTKTVMAFNVFLLVFAVQAADRTWDGGSSADSNWSSVDNWDGIRPGAGDALLFGGSTRTSNNNDLSADTAFSGLTFMSGAGAFILGGNGLTLDGNISNLSTSAKTLNLPLTLSGNRMLFGSNAAFTVNGVLSGPGGVNAAVTNTLTLTANNTYEGFTTVSNGCRLTITHPNALGGTTAGTRVFGRTGSSLRITGGIDVAEPITLVGQILPWISCLVGGTGSNVISGPLSMETDCRITVEGGSNNKLVFAGGVQRVSGDRMILCPARPGTIIFANKPIRFGADAMVQVETAGTSVLAVADNTFNKLKIANHATVRTDVAGALPPTCTLEIGGSWDADALLDMNGFDQTVGSLTSDGHPTTPGYLAVTSALPAKLTVNQGGNTTYKGDIAGAVSFIKNGGGTILFSNVVSTTGGELVLNNGTLALAENSGFGFSPSIRVNGGTLDLRSGTALSATAVVRVLDGAKIKIKAGVTNRIDSLYLDGEQQVAGTWGATGSGAAHINDAVLSGGGVLEVVSGTALPYVDAVWDGGGTDASASAPANWVGDTLPSFDGYSRAVFAAGGNTATFDAPVRFVKMTFDANTNFTVAAGAGVITNGAGGLRAGVPTTTSRTYTLAADLVFGDHQVWSLTNNGAGGTTVTVTGALSDGGEAFNLTKRGNGVLILSGNNSYSGRTTVQTNGYVIIRHANALGSTSGSTDLENGSYLCIEGGSGITLAEPVTMTGEAALGYQGNLRSNAGTNTLTGKITSNGARLRTNNSGCLEVVGGVDGAGLTCTAVAGTYIRFTEKPITTSAFTCHTYGGAVILAVAGNTFTSMEAGGTEFRTDVPNAWPPTLTFQQSSAGSPSSVVNFNGNDQSVGTLRSGFNDPSLRMLYSVAPMTLTVNQSADTVFNGSITGAVSLLKQGAGNLALTNRLITTSGSFTVSNGTLTVSQQAALGPNSTNIVVGGTGTLLLSNSVAIADSATVKMPAAGLSTAKISLAQGVDEKVGWLFFGEKMQRVGTYGSTSSPAAVKDDTHFSGTGLLTVLHDTSGTLLKIQ